MKPPAFLIGIFKTLAYQGREQATKAELLREGVYPGEISMFVKEGFLKEGVQGYWLPRPCDPGFLKLLEHHNYSKPHATIQHRMIRETPEGFLETYDYETTPWDKLCFDREVGDV
jgi:hypothetical protein